MKNRTNLKTEILGLICLLGFVSVSNAQSDWYACAACSIDYVNIGTITPTTSTQTVPNSAFGAHTNTFTFSSEEFVRLQFSATAGTKYCFSLSTQGSGTLSGNEIEILDVGCPASCTTTDNVWWNDVSNGNAGSITNNCMTFTAPSTTTYYIQLSDGNNGGTFFGSNGSEIVYFSYMKGGCSCSNGAILPVNLLYFNATYSETSEVVNLDWATTTEINNKVFAIERSSDGTNWDTVCTRAGAGNSTHTIYYTASDETPHAGISYYRLKQTDFDGNYSYSHARAVNIESQHDNLVIAPDPATTKTTVTFYSAEMQEASLSIYDCAGRLVNTSMINTQKGMNTSLLDISGYGNGLYIVVLTTAQKQYTSKMVVGK